MMIENILQARGIEKAAADLNWVSAPNPYNNKTPGWSYPVFKESGEEISGLTRWKAADSESKPKYVWFPQSEERAKKGINLPQYYTPAGLKKAIAKNGQLHFVSGEPDMLTLRTLGFRNVTCAFGEKSLSGLSEFLTSMGVTRFIYWRDRDTTGLQAAQEIRDTLASTDISFECRLLPGVAEKGYDLNRLWQDVKFDRAQFMKTIQESEAEIVPPTQSKRTTSRAKKAPNPAKQVLYERWCVDVENHAVKAWNLDPPNAGEYSQKIICPFHQEDTPSAKWNYRTHRLQCFGACGRFEGDDSYSPEEIAEKIGHESFGDFLERNNPQPPTPPARQSKPDLRTSAKQQQPPSKPRNGRNGAVPVVSGKAAAEYAINIIRGNNISEIPPIRAPYKPLWQFGGRIAMWSPRQVMLIISGSGFGKTAFIERICDNACEQGYDPFLWGPEWDYKSYFYRRVRRHDGPTITQQEEHEAWLSAQAQHATIDANIKPLSAEDIRKCELVYSKVQKWNGDIQYLDKSGAIPTILNSAAYAVKDRRSQERICPFIVLDYTQKGTNDLTLAGIEKVIEETTRFAVEMNMFVILLSQVNKDQANKLIKYGKLFDMTSAQMMSDKQFNAVITLNPVFDKQGNRQEQAWIRAVKNSTAAGQGKIKVRTKLYAHDWTEEVLQGIESETTENGHEHNTEGPPPREYTDADEPIGFSWVKD